MYKRHCYLTLPARNADISVLSWINIRIPREKSFHSSTNMLSLKYLSSSAERKMVQVNSFPRPALTPRKNVDPVYFRGTRRVKRSWCQTNWNSMLQNFGDRLDKNMHFLDSKLFFFLGKNFKTRIYYNLASGLTRWISNTLRFNVFRILRVRQL